LKVEIETEAAYLNRALEVAKIALEQYAGGKTWSYIATEALAEIRELTGRENGAESGDQVLRAIQPGDETDCPRCSESLDRFDDRLLCPTCLGAGRVVWRLYPTPLIEEEVE
jgi:hypothetical protein